MDAGCFANNRARLAASLPAGSLAVIATGPYAIPCGADSSAPWPDFYYFTGLRLPQAALLVRATGSGPAHSILFVPQRDARDLLWEGPEEAHGIDDVRPWTSFEPVLRAMAFQSQQLLVQAPENPCAPQEDAWLVNLCRRLLPLHPIDRLAPLTGRLRAVKQPAEIAALKAAGAVAADAFRRAIGAVRPGVRGFQIKAEFLHESVSRGSRGFACPPLTASGKETLTLHWNGDRRPWNADETALLDFTMEWNGLCVDTARCVPVGGRFSPRHRVIYDAAARALHFATAALRPGRLLSECQQDTALFLQGELLRLGLLKAHDIRDPRVPSPALQRHFMHDAYHHVGHEVHDPVPHDLPLAAGQVIAIEPGIYVPDEGFGIRLENTALLTITGAESLLPGLPVEAEAIETLLEV
jgi:Xaa-Pro aminopeptidase